MVSVSSSSFVVASVCCLYLVFVLLLFVRAKFGVSREDYANVGVLMDSLDVGVLVPFVDCCMNVFK